MVVDVERRQDDDLGRGRARADEAQRGEAVHPGHADVHEDDVRTVGVDRREHLRAVLRLADDLEVVGAAEHHRQPGAHERVVVDDQHADHAGHGSHAHSR